MRKIASWRLEPTNCKHVIRNNQPTQTKMFLRGKHSTTNILSLSEVNQGTSSQYRGKINVIQMTLYTSDWHACLSLASVPVTTKLSSNRFAEYATFFHSATAMRKATRTNWKMVAKYTIARVKFTLNIQSSEIIWTREPLSLCPMADGTFVRIAKQKGVTFKHDRNYGIYCTCTCRKNAYMRVSIFTGSMQRDTQLFGYVIQANH